MQIRALRGAESDVIEAIAHLLVAEFAEHWPDSWATLEEAEQEVRDSLDAGRISLAAIDDDGSVLGWIAGEHSYALVWELHPLVVRGSRQKQGVGRALVQAFEEAAREAGALTVMLGTDDEDDMTTLSGVDLYEEPWRHIEQIRNLKGHPYHFYEKLGYKIVGVVPDANGWGKPDIIMAKRVGRRD